MHNQLVMKSKISIVNTSFDMEGITLKSYITSITRFAEKNGFDHLRILDDLLDYIIGFLSPLPIKNSRWNYTPEQTTYFYQLMLDFFRLCSAEIDKQGWYDAWGDLFMELKGNSAGYRNQFFTPPCVADLAKRFTDVESETNCKNFGFRPVINDPTCGSARMLLAANNAYEREGKKKPYLIAEDIDFMCCKMSAVNIAIHGCYGEVICHNSLCEPKSLQIGYIINEGLYPSKDGLPTIRTTLDKSYFVFDFSEPVEVNEVKELTLF